MPEPILSVELPSALFAQVQERAEGFHSADADVVMRDIERQYAMYTYTLRRLDLSEAEASLLIDCLDGHLHTSRMCGVIWMAAEDGIRSSGLAEKWGIDGALLVAKLRNIDSGTELAIIDACERFWLRYCDGPLSEGLRRVGLVFDHGAPVA